jgi:hypothetical protein
LLQIRQPDNNHGIYHWPGYRDARPITLPSQSGSTGQSCRFVSALWHSAGGASPYRCNDSDPFYRIWET